MRYVGGKSRIAKKIAKVILESTSNRSTYVEPFVGGAAVAKEMGHHFDHVLYNDAHTDLMLMWDSLIKGTYELPDGISEEAYKKYRTEPSSAERGFAGFASSFGGKWFGGYARGKTTKGEPRNYVKESKTNILKCVEGMRGKKSSTCFNTSYENILVFPDSVVYCDPPYADTTGYSTGEFDHSVFWNTMEKWVELGAAVFVSEYTAPDGWDVVWETELQSQLKLVEQGRHSTVEKLFVKGIK